jgi:predicted TIM-barrel fold metal-dependent hydrolase
VTPAERFVPILDAHHHIWRLDRTPWLKGPMVSRIFGPYEAIRRDYSVEEFAAEARPYGVVASVYVQVNVAPGDEVWEVEWAAGEGRRAHLIDAVVGFADLAAPDVGDVLDRQRASSPLRGVRYQLHWHENPKYRFATAPDVMLQPSWQRGLRLVGARGLHFELQVFPGQYANALSLIDAHPDTTFVLLHCGMPEDMSVTGMTAWRAGLRRLAERPNVLVKLSALGTFEHRCDADSWRPIIQRTVDTFGPGRCMFGSNFPVEKLWTDYGSLLCAVRSALDVYTQEEQAAVLYDTAARLYRIGRWSAAPRVVSAS